MALRLAGASITVLGRTAPSGWLLVTLATAACRGDPTGLGALETVRAVAITNAGIVLGDVRPDPDECPRPLGASRCMATPFVWSNGSLSIPGTLGGASMHGAAIGPAGHVVGAGTTEDEEQRAFLWTESGIRNLGTLREWSLATGVNANSTVIGVSGNSAREMRGFVWSSGTMQDIGDLGGQVVEPFDINDRGQITGRAQLPDGSFHAFLWDTGVLTDLGTLFGTPRSLTLAVGITEDGTVAGTATEPTGGSRAVVWTEGSIVPLETLGPAQTVALAITDAGQVIGYAFDDNGMRHLVLWSPELTDLGMLDGRELEFGDMNEGGQVVGWTRVGGNERPRAFLWDRLELRDLGTLGGASALAYGINDAGVVVGESNVPSGDIRAFQWEAGVMRMVGPS